MSKTLQLLLMCCLWAGVTAQENITQVEYFLDADLGMGANTVLDIKSGVDIETSIVANIPTDIKSGHHKLFIRTKHSDGKWSHTARKNLNIVDPAVHNKIVAGEYFIDGDPAHTFALSFEVAQQNMDIEQEFMAAISADLTTGYHKLFARLRDANGHWSQTFRKNIEVTEDNETPQITEIEYFFDSDPTFGKATVLKLDDTAADVSYTFSVAYEADSYSFDNVLYVRAKDSNGNWSLTTALDEIDENLGIATLVQNTFTLYPNPVNDLLHIDSQENVKILGYSMYDLNGKKVFIFDANKDTYDLSELDSGMYILQIKTNKGAASYKIIKK